MRIPEHVEAVLETLELQGFQALIVGGAVRDSLMNIEPKDWDLATNATPDEIKELFPRHVEDNNSAQFGSIFVIMNRKSVEVTTFRKELIRGSVAEGRHPEVIFTDNVDIIKNVEEDSERRDFPINAIYMDRRGVTYDPQDGIADLKANTLRAVGKATDRFHEDPLRLIRAVRFMARGFEPDGAIANQMTSIQENKMLIKTISMERVKDEILSTLRYGAREPLTDLWNMGILEEIIPEATPMILYNQATPYHKHTLDMHALHTADILFKRGADPILILTGFLHDIGKPFSRTVDDKGISHYYKHELIGAAMVEKIFRRMKFSNRARKRAVTLVKYHMRLHQKHTTRNLNKTGHIMQKAGVYGSDLVKLYKADLLASNGRTSDIEDELPIPRLPITSKDVMKVLEEHYPGHNPKWRGFAYEFAWEKIYKKPNMSREYMVGLLHDYVRNLPNATITQEMKI